MRVELRQLTFFLAVAEECHFGRAAARLEIAAASVSRQVRQLEEELGVELFDRTTRRVTLTPAGALLVPHAAEVLAAERRATAAIDGLRHRQARTVRLATSGGPDDRRDDILRAYRELEPDGELLLSTGTRRERTRGVRAGELDATLLRGGEHGGGLEMVEVWTDALVVAVAADGPLAGDDALDITDLAGSRLRLGPPARDPFVRTLVLTACAQAGFSPLLGPDLTGDPVDLAAIAHDPEPSWTVCYEADAARRQAPGIALRHLRDPELAAPTFLAVGRRRRSPGIQALIAACRDTAVSRRRSRPRRGGGPGPPSSAR